MVKTAGGKTTGPSGDTDQFRIRTGKLSILLRGKHSPIFELFFGRVFNELRGVLGAASTAGVLLSVGKRLWAPQDACGAFFI